MPLLPGLIARAFFDTLTGQAQTACRHNGLIVLLVLLAVGRAALWLIAGYVETIMRFTMSGLLRRNLLRHILEPARRATRCRSRSARRSAASATTPTRPRTASTGPTTIAGPRACSPSSRSLMLLHINARMTLVVFLPLLVVVVDRAAGQRRAGPLPRGQQPGDQPGDRGDRRHSGGGADAAGRRRRGAERWPTSGG